MDAPTPLQLVQWKTRYGQIYTAEVEDRACYYRGLTPLEYMSVLSLQDRLPDTDWDDVVTDLALLHPAAGQFELPGSTMSLATFILDATTPIDADSMEPLITEAREQIPGLIGQNFPLSLAVSIASHFPSADLFRLLDLPMDQLAVFGALVEEIVGEQFMNQHLQNARQMERRQRQQTVRPSPAPDAQDTPAEVTPEELDDMKASLQDVIHQQKTKYHG